MPRKVWTSWYGNSRVGSPGKGPPLVTCLWIGGEGIVSSAPGLSPNGFISISPWAPPWPPSHAPPRASTARGAAGASGGSRIPTGGCVSRGWTTDWLTRGQAASGLFEKGGTDMGAQLSQECLLLSFQTWESRIPLASSRPPPPPPSPGPPPQGPGGQRCYSCSRGTWCYGRRGTGGSGQGPILGCRGGCWLPWGSGCPLGGNRAH